MSISPAIQIGLNYRINSATLITPSLQRANRDAVEADITGATETLRSNVSQQYLSALQAEATADLQDSLVVASQQELILAQAREIVGSGTQLDVQRAEVALGLQKVQALKARNQVEIEKLRLFQLMGVAQPPNVKLVSQFPVVPLNLFQDLIGSARTQNPGVLALRSREHVADLNVRREKGEYSPTLSLSTGNWRLHLRLHQAPSFRCSRPRSTARGGAQAHSYRGGQGRSTSPLVGKLQRDGV